MTESAQTISLNDIGLHYIGALQHLSDLMVFTWAGAQMVSEQAYEETFRSMAGLPSTHFRFPLETAKPEASRWWFKNSLGEVLGLCVVFLEDIRRICGLVAFNAAKAKASGDLVALAAEINSDTGPLDIPSRFAQLKKRYNLRLPLEAELLSLVALHQCFLQNAGTVTKETSLCLQLKALHPPGTGETEPKLTDYMRTWNEGERIALSREEHAAVFTTTSLFLSSTLAGVQEFAKASGLPENPSPQ